jgi:two-component sensor histidine kinase
MLSFNEMAASLQTQRQELNQRARTMESLYQIGLGLSSQRGLKAVLDTVINAVFQQVPAAWDVHLFSYEDLKLTFRASRYADGRTDILAQAPSPNGSTYTAAREGRIIEVASRSLLDEQGSDSLTGSMVCMPLKIGLQVVGVMNLAVTPPRRLEDNELRGLQLLCDQAAIAIHNARLDEIARHELLERRAAEEELRDLNAHLEQRIAQRTQELWLANEELRREADERQAALQRLSASLAEKEVLLREIHHRVKNNLQVISSMFNLQAGRMRDPQVVDVLRESQNRLRSMGLIHEKLYRSENLSQVDFSGYIESLAAFLFQAYRFDPQQVKLRLEVEAIDLPIDTAVPCGLLLNELIANALKHAFPAGRRGSLTVELKRLPGENILLRVADDGIGMPVTADPSAGSSLGMTLVHALADQLDGELEMKRDNGTEISLVFPGEVVAVPV